ncbi:hypothetical protein ACHMW5_13490 [Azospirillum melinis]|uniref:hypothetical protein n=1 Tax=Azospirillum melinis TaxID=328839 RepID=UPI003757BED9
MDAKTIEALHLSIAKWGMNANTARRSRENKWIVRFGALATRTVIGVGHQDCALCKLFYRPGHRCEGCPISAKVGRSGCAGTPYDVIFDMIEAGEFVADEKLVAACEAEVAFLRSLLPAEA